MSKIKCNEEPITVGPSTLDTVLPIDPIQPLYEREHVTTGIDLGTRRVLLKRLPSRPLRRSFINVQFINVDWTSSQ